MKRRASSIGFNSEQRSSTDFVCHYFECALNLRCCWRLLLARSSLALSSKCFINILILKVARYRWILIEAKIEPYEFVLIESSM